MKHDYKQALGLQSSFEVLKRQRHTKVVGWCLNVLYGLIGALLIIYATHVALG